MSSFSAHIHTQLWRETYTKSKEVDEGASSLVVYTLGGRMPASVALPLQFLSAVSLWYGPSLHAIRVSHRRRHDGRHRRYHVLSGSFETRGEELALRYAHGRTERPSPPGLQRLRTTWFVPRIAPCRHFPGTGPCPPAHAKAQGRSVALLLPCLPEPRGATAGKVTPSPCLSCSAGLTGIVEHCQRLRQPPVSARGTRRQNTTRANALDCKP